MQVYVAGGSCEDLVMSGEIEPPYMLASYYYCGGDSNSDNWLLDYRETDACNGFLVDSGAFSFLTNDRASDNVDFDAYLDEYIDFINTYDIDLFFELDIDSVVGTAKVREYRDRLERKTGKPSIPVWHPERGKDAFIRLIREYEYVSIGGIYDEISPKWFEYFPWFIEQAHNEGTRIHGLGFTPTRNMRKYRFDSVDSSNWAYGARYGVIFEWDESDGFPSLTVKQPEKRRKDSDRFNRHNLRIWTRYANYMDGKFGLRDETGGEGYEIDTVQEA